MATGLGAAEGGQIRELVLFTEATSKGEAQSMIATAVATLDSTDDPIMQVEKYDAGNTKFVGVASKDMVANEVGILITGGVCDIVGGTDIAAGEKIQADPTDSSFLDYASGVEHGIAVEAGAATGTTKARINGWATGGFGGT